MNKLIIYGILILTYLALSKSLSPTEYGIQYVNKKDDLAEIIPGKPVSTILIDIHSTGFIIKTYYQKFKVIYGFQSYEEIIVRTSSKFSESLKPYMGMSIFRRYRDGKVSFTPLPPGSVFIGDKNFGTWARSKTYGKVWKFYRVYRQIPKYLGWEAYSPSIVEYSKIQSAEELSKAYYGSNDEFGINGSITQKVFSKYFDRQKPSNINFKSIFETYIKENFIKQESP